MIEPRKNILSILKAFIELDEELDEDLVIVGKKDGITEKLRNLWKILKIKD